MLTSMEYQFPITADDSFGGVLFVDAGTVERDVEILDYRVALGFGFRVAIPGMGPVPLAFDFAFPVVQNANDDEQIFSFSVGWFN
jgi:outer membrane protein insertion porin family